MPDTVPCLTASTACRASLLLRSSCSAVKHSVTVVIREPVATSLVQYTCLPSLLTTLYPAFLGRGSAALAAAGRATGADPSWFAAGALARWSFSATDVCACDAAEAVALDALLVCNWLGGATDNHSRYPEPY